MHYKLKWQRCGDTNGGDLCHIAPVPNCGAFQITAGGFGGYDIAYLPFVDAEGSFLVSEGHIHVTPTGDLKQSAFDLKDAKSLAQVALDGWSEM